MGFDEKVDVIDLIINVLKDHEKTLDELISRIEGALTAPPTVPMGPVSTDVAKPTVSVVLRRWNEFRDRCLEANIVVFDVEEKKFTVSAVKFGVLHSYQEEMPDMEIRFKEKEEKATIEGIDIRRTELVPTVLRGVLNCGLNISIKGTEVKLPDGVAVYKVVYDIDAEGAKRWLAEQLNVEREAIFQGKFQI
jgi:hypothetical protein